MTGWIELIRSLGDSLIEVFKAEMAALQEDFARSGRHLGVALGLMGAAAVLLFWIVGLVLFTLIVVLDVWLHLWAASLIVLGLFVAIAAVLGWLGMRRLRQVENPVENVKRRVGDHVDWWQNTLLADAKRVGATASTAGSAGAGTVDDLYEEDRP